MISAFIKNFLEPFSYLIYAVAFLLEYRTSKSMRAKVLFIYYLVAVILISYACIIALHFDKDNNWLYNIFYFLSAIVFGYYFNSILIRKINKTIVLILFFLVAINFIITDLIFRHPYFHSFSNAFLFLCVVISSLLYLHELLNNMSEKNILLNFYYYFKLIV